MSLCKDCRCFVSNNVKGEGTGECRYFPPTKTVQPIQDELGRWGQQLVSSFPSTHEDFWCQQFIRKNNAVKT